MNRGEAGEDEESERSIEEEAAMMAQRAAIFSTLSYAVSVEI